MRTQGSGLLGDVPTVVAHHVGDLDHHVRSIRSITADLRDRIRSAQSQLAHAESDRARRIAVMSDLGGRLLATESAIARAEAEAADHLAAVEAAADEAVAHILERGRIEADQLRRALAAVVGRTEPAPVVLLTPRSGAADAVDVPVATDGRSVAM